MGKVCLSFVLSFVFVFSVSAQSRHNFADKSGIKDDVKVNTAAPETKTESARTSENKDETESMEFQKTGITALTTSASNAVSSLLSAGKSLGDYSTGNAVIDGYILDASLRHNVDPLLIYAQMSQESSFRKKATSHKGASGLMQLMPGTASRFGVKNIYDPQQNIEAGVKYMRWLLDKFDGDVRLALAGYNAGEGAVKKYGNQIPPFRETRNYVTKITSHYDKIKL
jgi:soluble lytic murein transglycosylase-like protein